MVFGKNANSTVQMSALRYVCLVLCCSNRSLRFSVRRLRSAHFLILEWTMKSRERVGITKEIDDLGRLQIPKDIRKKLGLDKSVELVVTEDGLLVKSEEYRLIKINEPKD